jgi:hypothetical protein
MNSYPQRPAERDRWILRHRPPRHALVAFRPHAFFLENERAESGQVVSVAAILLTNRECPWRCLMCDLWKNTLTETGPVGAIPAQIDFALQHLVAADASPRHPLIKLYNSGSFFDPRAVPPEDYPAIAERVRSFERVVVECHPALVGKSAVRFRDLLNGRLEVAMGLETVHPDVLPRLNKRMTLKQFARAADFLRQHDIALRVFILVKPPFLNEPEGREWACRSLDFAFDCGASVASLIPTRPGNGALDALAVRGEFSPPKLSTLESALDYGVGLGRGRVFADLWDLEKLTTCASCFPRRLERLREMNQAQIVRPTIECSLCATGL